LFDVGCVSDINLPNNRLRAIDTPHRDVALESATLIFEGSKPKDFIRAKVNAACASGLSAMSGGTPPISILDTTQTIICLGSEGADDGCAVGRLIGCLVGCPVGCRVGCRVGCLDGCLEGCEVGRLVGWIVGIIEGIEFG
jgi:hypothetical protein